MNKSGLVLKNLLQERQLLNLSSLPVKREISRFSRELEFHHEGVSSVIGFGAAEHKNEFTINLDCPLSMDELEADFGELTIKYNPRDDYSVVRFENLKSEIGTIEFVVQNKIVVLDGGEYLTKDPKGNVVIPHTKMLLKSIKVTL